MNENIDEQILLNARVDINNNIPIRTQILRIAVYDEFKAYETYTKIIEKFGLVEPFVSIKEAEASHYSALIQLMQKYNINVPINNWSLKVEIPNTLIECCEVGVATEINNIAMYNNLLSYAEDEDVKDLIFKLQAASYNNHLPSFRNCVFEHYSNNINNGNLSQESIIEKIEEYQTILNDIMSGNINENSISNIFSKINISMASGAVFGAALVALLNNYTSNQKGE